MVQRRDLLWSVLISTGLVLTLFLAIDIPAVVRTAGLLAQFRTPDAMTIPVTPFVFQTLKILAFYIVAGVVLGLVLHGAARVLASRRSEGGEWVVARRRYYCVFLLLLVLVTAYIHIHPLLLYPALFDNSWRWAALAGSPVFVTLFTVAGPLGVAIVLLLILRKRPEALSGGLRRWGLPVAAVALIVAGIYVYQHVANRPKGANKGPNIIFIGLDAVRPDHVSGLGYPRQTTPNLDRFLKEAVVFENAFVPLARTGPSWMSVLTACYPTRNNHRDDLMPPESRLPPMRTLADHLAHLGYGTSFFLDNSNFLAIEPEYGFQHIEQPDPTVVNFGLSFFPIHLPLYYYVLNNPAGFLYEPMLRANQAYSAVYQPRYFANAVGRHLVRMSGREKFFLAAHTCIGHAPFTVRYPWSTYFAPPPPTPTNRFTFREPFNMVVREKEFRERVGTRRLAGWLLRDLDVETTSAQGVGVWLDRVNATMRRLNSGLTAFAQEIRLYDSLVRQSDEWFGQVLDSIRRLGLYDNSIIVVMSDHGEDLYRMDHVYKYITSNHGFHIWGDDSYHVLLAIKFPKSAHAGVKVPWLVRSIDIAPTVLDAVGLPPLKQAQGVSLMPQIADPRRDPGLDTYAECGLTMPGWFIPGHRPYPFAHFTQFQYVDTKSMRIYRKQKFMAGFVEAKDRSLRDSRWKIIAYPMEGDPVPFKTTLHDVASDPTNRFDLSTSQPAALADMRKRLTPYIQGDAEKYHFQWQWMDASTTAPVKMD
jgi:arylsulfatase A-like enzyme